VRSFRRPLTELADGFGTEAIPTTEVDSPHYLGFGSPARLAAIKRRSPFGNGDRDERYRRFLDMPVKDFQLSPAHFP
jgi:hypothetical protein